MKKPKKVDKMAKEAKVAKTPKAAKAGRTADVLAVAPTVGRAPQQPVNAEDKAPKGKPQKDKSSKGGDVIALRQTPSQTVGPFFAYGLVPSQYGYSEGNAFPSLFDGCIADETVPGERIELVGRVFDGEGQPIPDAVIEILQADAGGRYLKSRDEAQPGFRGFGRVGTGTDPRNEFRFQTIKPGATRDGQAPHLDVIVLMRGLLVHAFTRIYFDGEAANERDPVLAGVPVDRRRTLLAVRESERGGCPVYRFDIRMQGADETVFFEV